MGRSELFGQKSSEGRLSVWSSYPPCSLDDRSSESSYGQRYIFGFKRYAGGRAHTRNKIANLAGFAIRDHVGPPGTPCARLHHVKRGNQGFGCVADVGRIDECGTATDQGQPT